jgi:hypothetical protein
MSGQTSYDVFLRIQKVQFPGAGEMRRPQYGVGLAGCVHPIKTSAAFGVGDSRYGGQTTARVAISKDGGTR